jgi:ribosomal-protein-alanine N-acetyltransferase
VTAVNIRPAEASDVHALVALEDQCFGSPNWTAEDFLKYESRVAELEGQVVGFIVWREVFAGDLENRAEREILNVAVAAAFRHRGIATALILQTVKTATEVFLEVRESNLAAQQLYRKHGFREVGRRPGYYQYPDETAIVMNMK